MFTPGQLLRHQRLRRAWTQRELARFAGIPQSQLAAYETDTRQPTWSVLCRTLAAMGLQPRVVAEPVDVTLHGETASVRAAAEELPFGPPPQCWAQHDPSPSQRRQQLRKSLQPSLSVRPLTWLDVEPVARTFAGLPYVIDGAAALRLQGIRCTVPYISTLLATGTVDRSAAFERLSEQMPLTRMQLWSPTGNLYLRCPTAGCLEQAAALSGTLQLRTAETATELRVQLSSEPLPPHVLRRFDDTNVPVRFLADIVAADPVLAAAVEGLVASRGSRWRSHHGRPV
jgi:transcriptional regulator with XRE-family HTH domain